jgi:hypothetical protein
MSAALGSSIPYIKEGEKIKIILFLEYILIGALQTASNAMDLHFQETEQDYLHRLGSIRSSGGNAAEKVTELSSVEYNSPSAVIARGEEVEARE